MSPVTSLLLGVLIGLALGLLWADVASIIRIAYKTRSHPKRAAVVEQARNAARAATPKWVGLVILLTGAALLIIGGAQVWSQHEFDEHRACTAQREAAREAAQKERAAASHDESLALYDFVKTIPGAVAVVNSDVSPEDRAFNKALQDYLKVANVYFTTVQKNPYPETAQEVCGEPKG